MNKEKKEHKALKAAFVEVMTKDNTLIRKGDLFFLAEIALKHEEISLSKFSELLGIPNEYARVIAAEMAKEWGKNEKDLSEDFDPHIGCYSYPNCDIGPSGCSFETEDPEPYGHK